MDHGLCKTHEAYGLDCDDFERLRARAGDACEICRTPAVEDPRWPCLHIDHDKHGVRGLLDSDCNTRLGRCEATGRRHEKFVLDDRQRAYLANPFWKLPESLLSAQRKADHAARKAAALAELALATSNYQPSNRPVPDEYRPLVEAALELGVRQSQIVKATPLSLAWVQKVAFACRSHG
ncbi:recombination endonuclease VII [Pseudonocardia sediminis]|uniref:Recombination endonuclease VII n=1 Tax=Pseudonocardia sediminis TaxID=1397368 RepID=A0A4Q7UZG5_PSEST|nr:endonuclease domain-containing protein [Pseudonocardia sediminis]RZT87547.1 recombination endonuclease VII [Pseudonocardia sediminis]